ncbi:MAG: phosphotransferase, partial [Deltaproteobacteria bacterium]|nr:phosphotransferase [Deltaproteobacteria bacterium]
GSAWGPGATELQSLLAAPALTAQVAQLAAQAAQPAGEERPALIHRDFQSRNVMLHQGRCRFVDWQGARLGPPAYDLASLLWDPYVELSEAERSAVLEAYLQARRRRPDQGRFEASLKAAGVMRLMQASAAYVHLTKLRGRPQFAPYLAPALSRLGALTEDLTAFPQIRALIGLAAELAPAPPRAR